MAEETSFHEIVQFEWRTGGDTGPDAASKSMIDALSEIDAKIRAIDANAQSVFGTSFATSIAPATASVGALNVSLAKTLELLRSIKEQGPIDPLGGGTTPPPPPNNPPPIIIPPGAVSGTSGAYSYNISRDLAPALPPPPPAQQIPRDYVPPVLPPPPSSNSGDIVYYGPGRLGLNSPSFLGGGISYAPPSEVSGFASITSLPEGVTGSSGWEERLRKWQDEQRQIGQRQYNKPELAQLPTPPALTPIGFKETAFEQNIGRGPLSEEEFQRQQDETARILMAGSTPPGWLELGGPSSYQKPSLTNFGTGGIQTNARLSDQWQTAPQDFLNSYSDLTAQAKDLSNITDLLKQFSQLRYGGPASTGQEVGFPVETGWTSTIYGGGTTLGGLLNGPQPQYIPGQGSTFGIPNWQTPPQQTINNQGSNYTYATGTGTRFDFPPGGYSSSGYYGEDWGPTGRSYQYTPPPPPGSTGTYGPGGYGTPGSPFQFGSGTVFPGAGNPNGFGMSGGLWGPGGNGIGGPPGPPWVAGGWQQGQNIPNFNPNLVNQVDQAGVSFENATNKAGNFERALGRIVTYSVIFAGFAAVGAVVRGVADEMVRLSDVQSRIGFVNGQSNQATLAQFTQAANYGISPAQAGQGILTAGQLGASPQQNQQAQQLALIFGADQYSNALVQLTRTQEQASATGLKHVNTLDFIAQSYKTLPGSLNDYFGALQRGIQLNAQFGVSAENMGLAIEKGMLTTGQSADQVAVAYQSILSKVATPATQKALEPLGIQRGDATTMVREITEEYQRLAQVGDRAGIEKLGEALQGGGIGGYSRIETLPDIFSALNTALNNTNPNLAKFSALLNDVSNSDVTKINQLTASWNNFLLALGSGIPGNAAGQFLDGITRQLKNVTDIIENGGKAIQSVGADPAGALGRVAKYSQDNPFTLTNLIQAPFNPARTLEQLAGLIDAATNGRIGGPSEGGRPGPIGIGLSGVQSGFGMRIPQSILNPYPNPIENFGGLQNLPQGVGIEQYRSMVQATESQLKIAGVPTDDKNYEVLSRSGTLLGQILADSNAIRITNDKIAQNTATFGGTPPSGVNASNATEFQAKVAAEDAKLKAAGISVSDPKTIVFQDKATDALFKIVGSNEAIQFATQTMAANAPTFSGMLPKGEDLNKIQARVSAIDQSGMVGAAGLDTTQVQKVFWDPVTNTLRAIHGTETAIQIATEEAAKLLQQQITGTFNVPAGGEAVVAFFALQQGFVPGGAGGPGAGAGGGAVALNGSATALNTSANYLSASAQALLLAAQRLGGPNGDILREIAAHEYANTSFRTPGTSPYYHSPNAGSATGYLGEFHTPQTSNYSATTSHPTLPPPNTNQHFESPGHRTGPGISQDDQLYQVFHQRFKEMIDKLIGIYPTNGELASKTASIGPTGMGGRTTGATNTNLSVNNAIRINIDGRQIAYYMNRKTYRQFESTRNAVSGVPNSVVTL